MIRNRMTTTDAPRRPERRQDELRALLAGYLTHLPVPSRMQTVRELAEAFGVSVGAVQTSLARLEQSGAVSIESRRGSGMDLTSRSIGKLWSAARGEPMIIALPLPISVRIQGLATGIKAATSRADIDSYLTFSRGSRRRLGALHAGRCHAVVMSALGASEACGPDEMVVLEFPAGSMCEEHAVYALPRNGSATRPRRVGIDRDSVDLQKLTELEFETETVEFVPAAYMKFSELMRDGLVDAAVWDVEEAPAGLPPDVTVRPLSPAVRNQLAGSNTRATVVVRKNDALTAAAVRECLDDPYVLSIQGEVISGVRLPEY